MKLKEFKDQLDALIERAKSQSDLQDIISALEDAKDDLESEAEEAEDDGENEDDAA
jgi:hypothetical protein